MSENYRQQEAGTSAGLLASSAARMRARQNSKIALIKRALMEAGYQTVCEQAKALNLTRSSAWAILQANHKGRGLSPHVIARIASSPLLPPQVREIIDDYVRERLSGAYGHQSRSLDKFRRRLRAEGFS